MDISWIRLRSPKGELVLSGRDTGEWLRDRIADMIAPELPENDSWDGVAQTIADRILALPEIVNALEAERELETRLAEPPEEGCCE